MVCCVKCDSKEVVKRGFRALKSGDTVQRYRCNDCGSNFGINITKSVTEDLFDEEVDVDLDDIELDEFEVFKYERSPEWIESNVYSTKRLVITAAQNNTPVNQTFFECLKHYCYDNDAKLLVIPIKHKTINSQDDTLAESYDTSIIDYLCENNLEFKKYNLRVYGGLRIQATAENPLSGLDPLSKGWSIILGHAQVQLKTLPNLDKRISDIICTTGAITNKNYSKTKLGEKARFNHSMSAVVIEFDQNHYHIRHLNFDEVSGSFFDLERQYFPGESVTCRVDALITGDEHGILRDSVVESQTYTTDTSIVNVLKPTQIVRHDSLDAFSISHHHRRNVFRQYAKWHTGVNSIENEIRETVEYINATTPDYATSLIVQSNHNEHLMRWLNEIDIKTEPWNAKIYHFLMYNMLEAIEAAGDGSIPDPFEMVAAPWLKENVKFINRTGYKIHGIEVGTHGDIGVNGARGSAKSFARIPDKMIVGHSHSPSIEKGCYTVGTSSKLSLEYNTGASTWHHAHVIIHSNGKRQMIFITPDGWRLM